MACFCCGKLGQHDECLKNWTFLDGNGGTSQLYVEEWQISRSFIFDVPRIHRFDAKHIDGQMLSIT